jgi:hypothetical protein
VTLPRSFTRAAAAVTSIHAGLTADVLARHLQDVIVVLSTTVDEDDALAPAYLLATNLLARLYPTLVLDAPTGLQQQASETAVRVNPRVALAEPADDPSSCRIRLHVGRADGRVPVHGGDVVTIDAAGWVAAVDMPAPEGLGPAAAPAALAGAAIGVGEVFRAVFARWLPNGGRGVPSPALWDLVSGTCRADEGDGESWTRSSETAPMLGAVHLAGAGAIGQAAALTWREASATGELIVLDHDDVDVGNLQRYVLADDADEGADKTEVIARALARCGLVVRPVRQRWGQGPESAPGRAVVAVALDTADGRLSVAAGTHGRVYNAWTGPVDLGWSRHETFGGDEPCLACLYLPVGRRPSLHEQIGLALGQDPLRVRMYLPRGVVLSAPLAEVTPLPGQALPAEAPAWTASSLIDDLVTSGAIPAADRDAWAPRHVLDLWHEGVCGGSVLVRPGDKAEVPVPLAHQSALAGVMLATQVIVAADPALRARRDRAGQGRLDLLGSLPQVIGRPRQVTPGCLCRDDDYGRATRRTSQDPAGRD